MAACSMALVTFRGVPRRPAEAIKGGVSAPARKVPWIGLHVAVAGVPSGPDESEHLREHPAELSAAPGVDQAIGSLDCLPQWLRGPDEIFGGRLIDAEDDTNLGDDV